MLGRSLPRSNIAPAKIIAVAETKVKPNAASGRLLAWLGMERTQLSRRTKEIGNVGIGLRRLGDNVPEDSKRQITEDGVCGSGLVEGVAVDPVLDAAGAGAKEGLEHHGQGGLATVHTGVEEADGRRDLPAENRAY